MTSSSSYPLLWFLCCGLPIISLLVIAAVFGSYPRRWYVNQILKLDKVDLTNYFDRQMRMVIIWGICILIFGLTAAVHIKFPNLLSPNLIPILLGLGFLAAIGYSIFDYVSLYRVTKSQVKINRVEKDSTSRGKFPNRIKRIGTSILKFITRILRVP